MFWFIVKLIHSIRSVSASQESTRGSPSSLPMLWSKFHIRLFLVSWFLLVTTIPYLGMCASIRICSVPPSLTTDSIQDSERQVLIMLFCIQIFIFAGTFAHMIIATLPDAKTAGAVATLLFSMTMIFNGWANLWIWSVQ
jgi:hypothetical protein